MINTKNPGVLEAIKEIKVMSLSKRMRLRHEAHLKEIRDKKAREDYVRLEGRMEERMNTERERQRADAAEGRANVAESRANVAENRANVAEKEFQQLKEEMRQLREEYHRLKESQ